MPQSNPADRFVLVLAPRGRDASVIEQVLAPLRVPVCTTSDLAELTERLGDDAYAAIITEESLTQDDAQALEIWIENQPPWSDFQFVVLATKQTGRRSLKAAAALAQLGNEIILERPLNAETLLSAVNSAIRSRRRQYEARGHLQLQEEASVENRRLYEAERVARAEAEAADSAKEEFLAVLSHELRTPLSAILGWTYVLQQRRAELGDLARGIDTIQRNANSQAKLIEDLLDMSRIAAGKVSLEIQTVVPAQLIEQVLSSILPAAQIKRVTIEADLAAALLPMAGDTQRLLQVFRNLLTNALKFTPEDGTIRVIAHRHASVLKIEVIDSGIGISADFLPHVFDRFRQADGSTTRSQGGLGLGLAIVRRLVELHGGSSSAASDGPGRGATFSVMLPLEAALSASMTTPTTRDEQYDATASERRLQDVSVLLVEDDPDGREMVAQLLQDHGARVVAVESAAFALTALRDGIFDVVVSDIGMPVVDGYELLRQIRAQGNPIPAVALTAFARAEDKAAALEVGFDSHVSKPVQPQALIASLVTTVRRGR